MKKQNYITKTVIDMTTGITYNSLTEAAKAMGVHISSISLVVHGKMKACKGHRFCFTENSNNTVTAEEFSPIKIKARRGDTLKKKVKDMTTGIVYDSITEAAKALGVHRSSIGYAANGNIKTVKKHAFSFVDNNESHHTTTKKIYSINKGKSTLCLTTGEIYKSAIEAAHMNNLKYSAVIDSCRKGSRCADSGLTFCYLEDAPYRVMDIVSNIRTQKVSKELNERKEKQTNLLKHKAELDAKQAEVLKELEEITKEINDLESKLN